MNGLPVLFSELSQLAIDFGASNLKDYAGCWGQQIDEDWYFAINGHDVETEASPPDGMEFKLRPYSIAVWFGGFLCGTCDANGGSLVGGREDDLIAAIQTRRRHLSRESGDQHEQV